MGCMISCDRQALLGWLTYRVYALVLVRIMETHRVLFEGGFFFCHFCSFLGTAQVFDSFASNIVQ